MYIQTFFVFNDTCYLITCTNVSCFWNEIVMFISQVSKYNVADFDGILAIGVSRHTDTR